MSNQVEILHATYDVVTPLFCGGASPDTPELHLPSVKGVLRWYWRAAVWQQLGGDLETRRRWGVSQRMTRSIALAAALAICPAAAAEEAKPTAGPVNGDGEDLTMNLPDPSVLRPRAGLHVGFGAGLGVGTEQVTELQYVSGPEAVLHVDLNYGFLRIDTRLSFMGYWVMSSSRPVTGLGLAGLGCGHWNSRFMICGGYGLVVQHDSPMGGGAETTVYSIGMASPVTIRLGARRNVEVGLQLLAPRDMASHLRSMAAYLSLSYLLL